MSELVLPHRPGGLVVSLPWAGTFRVEKFWADDDPARAEPWEVVEGPNALLTAGAQAIFQRMGDDTVARFNASNARLCVGNGTAAVAAGQTDLQGASKTRKIVDSAPVISGNTWTLVATFGTGDANHAWEEAGIANHASAGVLLNRVVQNFGTKTSGMTWVLTAVATLGAS